MPDVSLPEIPANLIAYMESSTIALALAAPDGDTPLVLTNPAFEKLTGYPASDVVGQNCRLLQGDADNREARAVLQAFLVNEREANVRVPIINFKRDGTPFVNLLYMSRLRADDGITQFFFASQFDVSRTHPDLLLAYDASLRDTLAGMTPLVAESGIIIEGSLTTVANSAQMIAQAKLMLTQLEGPSWI